MTSFVFETVRKYQCDSYMNITLQRWEGYGYGLEGFTGSSIDDSDGWKIMCQTPSSDERIEDESFTPGDYIEMFDHKLNKVYKKI